MKFINKGLMLLSGSLFFSCTDCDKLACVYKERECYLVIHNKSVNINSFYKGVNPYTGEECDCTRGFRDYMIYDSYLDIGDTLVKKKGDMFLSIHKKDTIMIFKWKCKGKEYN